MHRRPRPARLAAALGALVVVALGLVAPASAARPAERAAPSSVRATHQVVVRWAAADLPATRRGRLAALGNPRRVAGLSRAAGMHAAFVRPFGTAGTTAVYRFEEPLGADANSTLDRLNATPGVVLAEADPIATIDTVPNDTYAPQLWGQLGAADGSPYGIDSVGAWATATGTGTVVAVLDTGIRTHADLAGQTVAGYDFIADPWTANDGDGRDGDPSDPGDFVAADQVAGHCAARNSSWHGTHVSGIVAAIANNAAGVFGAAPGTKVQPLRVLGRCGGSYTDIADAVTWASGGAVLGTPANATPADVVNLSLGSNSSCPAFFQSAITAARSRGTLAVVAAGNSGVDATGHSPADCQGVVVVAATDINGKRATFGAGSSSNYGAIVDVAAPGASIISTWNLGTTAPGAEGYGNGGGTSQAAPHVAAIAAMLRGLHSGAQPAALERALRSSSKAFAPDADPLGCPTVGCGTGIANAPAALAFIATADIEAPEVTITPPTSPTKSTTLAFSLAFDESVSGLATTDLIAGGTATGCVIGTPSGGGAAWSVNLTGCGNGTVTLTLKAQGVQDAVANVGPDDDTTSAAVTVDHTPPASVGAVTATATNGTSVSVAYTASDSTGTGVASVQAFYATTAALTSPTACGSVVSGAASGTIACTIPATDATYRIFTRATDVVGNVEAAPGTADDTIVRDTVAPTATVTPAALVSRTGSVAFTINTSEAVTGLAAADVVVGGTATGCAVTGFTPAAASASVVLGGCSDGTVVPGLASGAVTDTAGNPGPTAEVDGATVLVDSVAPTAGTPSVAIRTNTPLTGTAIPITVAWTGSDNAGGAGIASYTLQRSTNGGTTWSTVASGITTTSRTTTIASSGSTRFRVRAIDKAGNAVYSAATSRSGRLVQNSSSAVHYSSPWGLTTSSSYSGGSARYTSTSGRSASYTFTGRSIALVVRRGTTRGKVKIYVDGVLQATVDTYRSSTQYRSVVWRQAYPSTVTKTIRVVVLATSGRPRVDLDAFAVLK